MDRTEQQAEAVILVHGLWLTGVELSPLRWRLRRSQLVLYVFHYPSVRRNLSENAARLRDFADQLPEPVVHYVGHSLGGLVIQRLFADFPARRPGRVVTLGTPHLGSRVAATFGQTRLGRFLFGCSLQPLVSPPPPASWNHPNELGVIAGDLPVGMGRVVTPALQQPHDGTVEVASTILEGASDRIVLPVTHTSMLLSRQVADQTLHFLRHGRFAR